MKRLFLLTAVPLALAVPLAAQEEPITPDDVVAAAAPEEWVEIAAEDLLVMELAPDADGNARQVVIQLMPAPFSQPWVENIHDLARVQWWDGKSVYRAVDNWVVQWGGGDTDLEMDPGPLPEGVVSPDSSYDIASLVAGDPGKITQTSLEFFSEGPMFDDSYIPGGKVSFRNGWPIGLRPQNETRLSGITSWPIHCYGSVGVAREIAPDTGTGAELYAVIGHAPRHLDRNIAVVGRVIDGMEHLSMLKRGTGPAGFYETRAEDTPIISVRLGSEVEAFPQPRYEYLSTDSESFARYVEVRANRNDAFYTVPADGVDICNVPVPVRPIASD